MYAWSDHMAIKLIVYCFSIFENVFFSILFFFSNHYRINRKEWKICFTILETSEVLLKKLTKVGFFIKFSKSERMKERQQTVSCSAMRQLVILHGTRSCPEYEDGIKVMENGKGWNAPRKILLKE